MWALGGVLGEGLLRVLPGTLWEAGEARFHRRQHRLPSLRPRLGEGDALTTPNTRQTLVPQAPLAGTTRHLKVWEGR